MIPRAFLIGAILIAAAWTVPGDEAMRLGEKAIQSMRSLKGYRVQYQTKTQPPGGTPFEIQGAAMVINPDIFFTSFTGSGDRKLKILRKGDQVRCTTPLYEDMDPDPLKTWMTPEELGENDAGMRHNPDHVMSILKSHLNQAAMAEPHKVGTKECLGVTLEFKGKSIRQVMIEHGIKLDHVDWDQSTLSARLSIGKDDSLIHLATLKASVFSTNPNMRGRIEYEASFTLTDVNSGLDLKDVPEPVLKLLGITPVR